MLVIQITFHNKSQDCWNHLVLGHLGAGEYRLCSGGWKTQFSFTDVFLDPSYVFFVEMIQV